MEKITMFLEKMSETSSLNEKRSIFKEFSENETILKIFKYAYDNVEFTFGIKPTRLDFSKSGSSSDIKEMFSLLDNLNNRTFSGNSAVKECNKFIENSDKNISNIFYKILNRDLKIGFSKKEFNKLASSQFKCKSIKYCRCDTFNKKAVSKFEFPAFIQLKCDGTYREVHIHNGEVQIRTRSGEPYSNPVIEDQMKDLPEGYYMGEFTIGEADQQFNRFEANGNINSDNPNYNNIHFTMWDYVTEKEYNGEMNKPYHLRFNALEGIIGIAKRLPHRGKNLHTVISKEVNDMHEALKFVSGWMSFGLEGGVLKSKNAKFKNGTSKEQLKIKLSIDLEMRCKGFLLGTEGTRFEGKNKVILFENDEGTIKGQCSGMTDAMVDEVTKNPNKYIGKVLTIQFNDLSKADGNEYYALSHPRFKEWRDDKDETDTLEKAFKMKEMATTLKD